MAPRSPHHLPCAVRMAVCPTARRVSPRPQPPRLPSCQSNRSGRRQSPQARLRRPRSCHTASYRGRVVADGNVGRGRRDKGWLDAVAQVESHLCTLWLREVPPRGAGVGRRTGSFAQELRKLQIGLFSPRIRSLFTGITAEVALVSFQWLCFELLDRLHSEASK